MMRAYCLDEASGASITLAEQITALILDSAVTYKEAVDALEVAEKMLMNKTKPVKP